MSDFEDLIVEQVRFIRSELQKIETLDAFEFIVKAEGRVHEGELKIVFSLDHPYEMGVIAKGGDINVVLEEFMRRFGWNKRNNPLMISNGSDESQS